MSVTAAASVRRLSERRLRRWADGLRIALGGTVVVLAVAGRPGAAVGVALIAATALAARAARAPAAVEATFVTLLALDVALTVSGLMARIDRHDTLGHLLLTAAVTPVLAAVIRLHAVEAARPTPETAVLAGLAAVGLALGWEAVEWSSDVLLGTNMSLGAMDTGRDLLSGLVGAAIGTAYLRREATMAPCGSGGS